MDTVDSGRTVFTINPVQGSQDTQAQNLNARGTLNTANGRVVRLNNQLLDVNPNNPFFILYMTGYTGAFYYNAVGGIEQSPFIITNFKFRKNGSLVNECNMFLGQISSGGATNPPNYFDAQMPENLICTGGVGMGGTTIQNLNNINDPAFYNPSSGISDHAFAYTGKTAKWSALCTQIEITQTLYQNDSIWGGWVGVGLAPTNLGVLPYNVNSGFLQQSY